MNFTGEVGSGWNLLWLQSPVGVEGEKDGLSLPSSLSVLPPLSCLASILPLFSYSLVPVSPTPHNVVLS